jgi:DNA-binding MarR family transcriptional regulator
MSKIIMSDKIKSDRATTRQFLELLHQLQKIDPEFPLQYAVCLTEISLDEGCSLTTLAERANLTLSTISRIVGALSDYRQNGQPYGLVEIRISAAERRRKELYLTTRGRTALQKIGKVLEQGAIAA